MAALSRLYHPRRSDRRLRIAFRFLNRWHRLKPVPLKSTKPSDFSELAAFEGRRDRGVHKQFREMLGRVIQFIDALADELVVAAGGSFLQRGNTGGDFRAFLRGQTG